MSPSMGTSSLPFPRRNSGGAPEQSSQLCQGDAASPSAPRSQRGDQDPAAMCFTSLHRLCLGPCMQRGCVSEQALGNLSLWPRHIYSLRSCTLLLDQQRSWSCNHCKRTGRIGTTYHIGNLPLVSPWHTDVSFSVSAAKTQVSCAGHQIRAKMGKGTLPDTFGAKHKNPRAGLGNVSSSCHPKGARS